jgi:hypothetical protein
VVAHRATAGQATKADTSTSEAPLQGTLVLQLHLAPVPFRRGALPTWPLWGWRADNRLMLDISYLSGWMCRIVSFGTDTDAQSAMVETMITRMRITIV